EEFEGGYCLPIQYVVERMGEPFEGNPFMTDEQVAALDAAMASPEWGKEWSRLYELIGRAVAAAAAVDSALTPLVTFMLNPMQIGHARWAVETLDHSEKLRILVKL